jgi:hypothetical protein
VQTAAWLVRVEQDFARSMIVLAAARNVRYGNFVPPGSSLRTEAELLKLDGETARFKAVGTVGEDRPAVQGRLELRCFNLAGRYPAATGADQRIVAGLRRQFALIGGPEALAAG